MSKNKGEMMGTTAMEFTRNEQNVLAEVAEVLSRAHYAVNVKCAIPKGPFAGDLGEDLLEIVERFPSTNWGEIYDKFHRRGSNV